MASTNQPPQQGTRTTNEWAVSYNQSDVDNIREQIEQTESAKRRWLFLVLIISLAALAGAIVLLSTNYALYSSSESAKKKLLQENTALKSRADQTQQQLDAKTAQERKEAELSSQAQERLSKVLPAVMRGDASTSEVASFARMVHDLPHSRLELASKPPDKLFRNWRVNEGSGTVVYTLVGGFVDGKWVVCSNLVARKAEE
jgi:cell division protein FtsB